MAPRSILPGLPSVSSFDVGRKKGPKRVGKKGGVRSEAADGGARGSLNYLVSPTFPCPEAENDEEREKMNISYDNTRQMLILFIN